MSNYELTSGFARFLAPVLEVLKELGGSARSAQVKDLVMERLKVTDPERAEVLSNGVSRVSNQIDWARFYLVKSGYLGSSKRGVWTLTEHGKAARLSVNDVRDIVRKVSSTLRESGGKPATAEGGEPGTQQPLPTDFRIALLNAIKSLPAKGFEELCRYLLLESGFEEVTVVGRSGDGGIDGHGVLRVSKLVSMKVLFQCKRFADAVGPSVVRDFEVRCRDALRKESF